jgi:hypothetical protein
LKPLFNCELNYFPSAHLNQIYDGFEKLRKSGLINISVKPVQGKQRKPVLTVIVNKKYKVIYDTLDGLNWVDGSVEENLNYLKNNISADFYFKRSFNKQMVEYAPHNCIVQPLGFNYSFNSEDRFSHSLKRKLIDSIRNSRIVSKYFSLVTTPLKSKDFEFYPVPNRETKILFLTKLWNPAHFSLEHSKTEVEKINETRIACIKRSKKEFGDRFVGGVEKSKFSTQVAKELTLPLEATQKRSFIQKIREHNICIATTGLHGSLGWKFGEYIAASRAVISEPMIFDVPGNFEKEKNYLEFSTENDLVDKISSMLTDKDKLSEMMMNNFNYYNKFLRPDMLVLITLLKLNEIVNNSISY